MIDIAAHLSASLDQAFGKLVQSLAVIAMVRGRARQRPYVLLVKKIQSAAERNEQRRAILSRCVFAGIVHEHSLAWPLGVQSDPVGSANPYRVVRFWIMRC